LLTSGEFTTKESVRNAECGVVTRDVIDGVSHHFYDGFFTTKEATRTPHR
jgi:hypothetical protein